MRTLSSNKMGFRENCHNSPLGRNVERVNLTLLQNLTAHDTFWLGKIVKSVKSDSQLKSLTTMVNIIIIQKI